MCNCFARGDSDASGWKEVHGHSLIASSKSSVFRFFLKLESELLSLQWLPRLFQTDGAAQLNPRMAPEDRTNRFSKRRLSQDRSWRLVRETWSLRSAYRYLGSALHRTLYVITAILNLIRCSIGSQCSWMSDVLASLDHAGRYSHYSCEFVLNVLKLFNIGPWSIKQQGVAVVQPRCDQFMSDCFGGLERHRFSDVAQGTDVKVELRESWLKYRIWCRSRSSAVRYSPDALQVAVGYRTGWPLSCRRLVVDR